MAAKDEVEARAHARWPAVIGVGLVCGIVCGVAASGCGLASSAGGGANVSATPELPPVRGGEDRLGRTAPPLRVDGWIGDDPGTIEQLRGRVVLVRFWTDTCPYCEASAPALVELDRELADRGLVVLAIHHPKPRGTATPRARVAEIAARWGFTFPVGLDGEWRTVDGWWLDSGERAATSATLVVDRRGVIRWVHPGPEYHPGGPADHQRCRDDYADLRRAVEALLAEP